MSKEWECKNCKSRKSQRGSEKLGGGRVLEGCEPHGQKISEEVGETWRGRVLEGGMEDEKGIKSFVL